MFFLSKGEWNCTVPLCSVLHFIFKPTQFLSQRRSALGLLKTHNTLPFSFSSFWESEWETCAFTPSQPRQETTKNEKCWKSWLTFFKAHICYCFQMLIQKKRHTKVKECTICVSISLTVLGFSSFEFQLFRIKNFFIKTSLVQYSAGSLEKENPLTTSKAFLLMVSLLDMLIQILLGRRFIFTVLPHPPNSH